MKHLLALASVVLLLSLSGCNDSHEAVAGDSVSTMKEMTSILEGVKDQASAQSAKPKLKALMEKMESISQRQAKLAAPTEAEIKAMDAKYGKEMEEVARKWQAQVMRVMFDPKIGPELQDIDMKKGVR